MAQEIPPVPEPTQLSRGINVARAFAIIFVLLPLVVLIGSTLIANQMNANPTENPALYETIQTYIYSAVVASCLLIPVVAIAGLRMTFRKRAITQKTERGRIFLSSLVVWVVYAFLTVALFILWNLTPEL